MAKKSGITSNEKHFRQWFAVKCGGYKFANSSTYTVKQGISDIERNYKADNKGERTITYPTCRDYISRIVEEVQGNGFFNTYTDSENFGFEISETEVDMSKTVSKTIAVGNASSDIKNQARDIMATLAEVIDCDTEGVKSVNLGEMVFEEYAVFKTGTVIDEIMSNPYEQGQGCYSKNIIMAFGESGVGKSTQLMDMISLMDNNKENDQTKKYGYVLTEMLKSDLAFYLEDNPLAKNVPIIPLMSYIISGRAVETLIDIFLTDKYDFIVLDSLQDLAMKLVQYNNMKLSEAVNMLLSLVIASAEKFNKSIIIIQHATKDGDYIGSTFLKHSVTATLEYRFEAGERYMMFSKNRRGGKSQGLKIFYTMNQITQRMEYDRDRFEAQKSTRNISKEELYKQRTSNLTDILNKNIINDEEEQFETNEREQVFTNQNEQFIVDIEFEEVKDLTEMNASVLLDLAIEQVNR